MHIEQRVVGRVTVLDLHGSMTYAEGHSRLTQAIDELIASGRTLVVLNLERVPYIDSSGLMELVRAFINARRAGGRLWLSDPSKRIAGLLSITNLLAVFDVVTEQDLPNLQADPPLLVECPMCRPPTRFSFAMTKGRLRCPGCGVELGGFQSAPWTFGAVEGTFPSTALVMPTYDGECIELNAIEHDEVVIRHRFDRFVFDPFERLWHALPAPRRLIISVKYADTSQPALQALLDLLARSNDGSLLAIVMPDISRNPSGVFARPDIFHQTMEMARMRVPGDPSRPRGVPVRLTRGPNVS